MTFRRGGVAHASAPPSNPKTVANIAFVTMARPPKPRSLPSTSGIVTRTSSHPPNEINAASAPCDNGASGASPPAMRPQTTYDGEHGDERQDHPGRTFEIVDVPIEELDQDADRDDDRQPDDGAAQQRVPFECFIASASNVDSGLRRAVHIPTPDLERRESSSYFVRNPSRSNGFTARRFR